MNSFMVKANTALALGVPNLARAISYRLGVKFGLNPVRRVHSSIPAGPFFMSPVSVRSSQSLLRGLKPVQLWCQQARYFGRHPVMLNGQPPVWHCNPLNGAAIPAPERPWWQIPDFDPAVGDIKVIWEASRFDWVLSFAQRAVMGDLEALARLNNWLADWLVHNPPYCGPNWKCGQEASIRVMHLAMAALLLEQAREAAPGLVSLVELHLKRIIPTLSYAMAQDNNHGTSEAAALYIGGSWLALRGVAAGQRWQQLGAKWLENRVKRLIAKDGSFSQYSLNYHRVMLDTLSMVELWRRRLGLTDFTVGFYRQVQAATFWLHSMINQHNGDGPNLGANDGARLLPLTDSDYRDFRPSVQLAMVLFEARRAYADDGEFNQPLLWMGLSLPEGCAPSPGSRLFDDGGFAVLRQGKTMAMLRYPRFRFRPSQADALHVDLWLAGKNLLRDAGTYSYHTDSRWLNYFPGTAGHNTVQFDERDQMPRLGRFLFGRWLKTRYLQPIQQHDQSQTVAAGYRDDKGATHRRRLELTDTSLLVEDQLGGFHQRAVLRWRLAPGEWRMAGDNRVTNGEHWLKVSASVPIVRFVVTEGFESRYYLQKETIPVLEVVIQQPGTISTQYGWYL